MVELFAGAGDAVVFCSRSPERVAEAEEASAGAAGRVSGVVADVGARGGAAALADAAASTLGGVDVWINNAGVSTFGLLADAGEEEIESVVRANTLGTLLGARAALRLAAATATPSSPLHLFNMDGAGSDGGGTPRFAAYGATKASLAQLHRSLRAEIEACPTLSQGLAAVHRLSPGMMTTELLMKGAGAYAQSNLFINALAEPAPASAAFLVPAVRAIARAPAASGPAGGPSAAFLTRPKALAQIAARLIFGARKGRWVAEE
jgi:chlorophyll(ide) b reductase